MIVALSDFYTLHRTPAAANKVKDLLAVHGKADVGVYGELLAYTRLPAGSIRPPSSPKVSETDAKYKQRVMDAVPESVDGYLQMYLTSHAKFRTGGKVWNVYQRTYTPLLVSRQRADGAFPIENEEVRPTVTALVVLSFAQLHAAASRFSPEPNLPSEPDLPVALDIE